MTLALQPARDAHPSARVHPRAKQQAALGYAPHHEHCALTLQQEG
jgi:hypothetical protein